MPFEWDPEKARTNVSKHGVSFEEPSTAFLDDFSLTDHDPDHSWIVFFREPPTISCSQPGTSLVCTRR